MTVQTLPVVRPTLLCTDAGIDAALAVASREVLVARSRPPGPAEPLRRADHDNLRRGVRYRILLPDQVRTQPVLGLRLGRLALTGVEVRTLPVVPTDATVVDDALAMLPGERRPHDLAIVRLSSVVGAVTALFDQLWVTAAPWTTPEAATGAGLTARERELLALLSAGCTDESAAARLGISVRTVRRMMAAIMTRLGARSRFQAGLKAADRGLLAHAG
ncbi:helix-turn-helix transcriptional regulator [Jidongwangia harbinensis]|uniref:helix-turn-helix transcriptional regulator n=1 Tax=Jidongwangia harbinensis TaxID=2878561 RepID=UPI001CDA0F8A|nr:helix-turn-helix transcriptional regulator [Jidongwangia harbinensis]MCA2218166.1 helix-turn-helix transcriptional regulator [Jidongwangia harbinensis]